MDSVNTVVLKLKQINLAAGTLPLRLCLANISHTSLERICHQKSEELNSVGVCVFVPVENSSYMEVIEQPLALSLSQQPKSAALSGFSLAGFLPP